MEISLFPLIQNGYFFLHDAQPNKRIIGSLTRSGQTHSKSLYQLLGNIHAYLHAKNILHEHFYSCNIPKILQTSCFGYFGHVCQFPLKTIMPVFRNFMFVCMQKMNIIPNFFLLRYCEDIANLLLCILWEHLIIPTL